MGWFFSRRRNVDSLWESMDSVTRMLDRFDREGEAVAPRRNGAIVFRHDDTVPFLASLGKEMNAILYDGPAATKTAFEFQDDDQGMRWVVLNDGDFDDLLSSLFTVANAIKVNGGAEHLLAAVCEFDFTNHSINQFEEIGSGIIHAYLIFRFDRNAYYPFVPTSENPGDRDRETERMLGEAVRRAGLKVEPSKSEWLGLWGIPF